jgi:hypothetical protein
MLLLSALTGAVVNPGNMLTADGQRRLQATHSLWRGEPPVLPSDQHVFGNVGRDGRIYAWYGLGHSLYMLPFDAASHAILGALPVEESLRRKADSALVAWMSQSVLLLLALFSARGLLLRLGFHDRSASLGTAALLFATTVLHYVQNAQENLLLLACGLLAFHAATRWSDTGLRRDAFAAGAAAGFAILTRLTAALDVACLLIFAALLLRGRLARFARQAAPAFLLFALIERLYNFHRFGNWLGSYMPNMRDPLRGPAPVFARPFSEGFFGALFAPDVSVFLFDPLLAPAFVLIAIAWSKLSREVRVYAACGVLLLFAHITFHARYDTYSGEVAWGHRYAAGGVQLIALLAVPLAVAHWRSFNTAARSAIALCAIAAGITQLSSVMVVMGVEELQMERDGHAVFVLARRWENIGLVWSNRAEGHPLFRGVPREWTRPAPLPFQLEFRHAQLKRIAVPAWWALVVLTLAFAVRLAFSSTPSPGPPPHHAHLSPRRATRPSAPA